MAELSVGIDSSGAVKGGKEVTGALDNIGNAANNVTKEIEKMSGSKAVLNSMSGWFKDVGVNLLGLLNPLTTVSSAVNLFFLAFEPIKAVAGFFLELLNPMNLLNAAFSLLSGGVNFIIGIFTNLWGAIQSGLQFFANLKLSMDGLLSTFSALSAPIIAVGQAFGAAVNTSADFQVQMSNIQAVSLASSEDILKIRDAALQVGRDTPLAASAAATALLNFSKAGLDATNAVAALEPAVKASLASGAELDLVSKTLINTTNAMGLSFDDAAATLDILLMTTTKTNQSMQGLGDGLSYVAPTLSALNQTLETGAAAMGKLADAGFDGSRAGTGLNQILLKLQTPTKDVAAAFGKFGISLADVNPLTNDFVDILAKMESAGMQSADVIGAFGIRAGPQLGALLTQGSESVRKLSEELQGAAGTGAKMFEIQTDNLRQTLTSLEGSMESLQIAIGDVAQKGFTLIVAEAINVTNAIRGFILESGLAEAATAIFTAAGKELVEIFRLFKPIIDPTIETLKALGGALTEALPADMAAKTTPFINGMTSITEATKTGITEITKWIDTWSKVLENSTVFQNALTTIGGAIDSVVTSFLMWTTNLTNWNTLATQAIGVGQQISTIFLGLGQTALNTGKQLLTIVDAFVDINREGISIDLVSGMTTAFNEVINFIQTTGVSAIKTAFGFVSSIIYNVAEGFAPKVLSAIQAGDWTGAGAALYQKAKDIINAGFGAAKGFLTEVFYTWIPEAVTTVQALDWSSVTGVLKGAMKAIWEDIKGATIPYIADFVGLFSTEMATDIGKQDWTKVGTALSTAMGKVWKQLEDYLKPKVSAFISFIVKEFDDKMGGALSAFSSAMGYAKTGIDAVSTAGTKLGEVFVSNVEGLDKNVQTMMKNNVELVKMRENYEQTEGPITKLGLSVENTSSKFESLPLAATEATTQVTETFTKMNEYISNTGKDVTASMMKNMASGISENVSLVEHELAGVGQYMIGQSPPPEGPLKNIDIGGENVIKAWIGGMANLPKEQILSQIEGIKNMFFGSDFASPASIDKNSSPTASTTNNNKSVNMNGISINVNGGGTPEQNKKTGQDVADALLNQMRKMGVSLA